MENQWEGLKCNCGSEEFIVSVKIRWRAAGGLTNQAAGYRCANCRKIAPIDRMINELKQRHAEQKIAELQEEANALTPRDQVQVQKGNKDAPGVRAG